MFYYQKLADQMIICGPHSRQNTHFFPKKKTPVRNNVYLLGTSSVVCLFFDFNFFFRNQRLLLILFLFKSITLPVYNQRNSPEQIVHFASVLLVESMRPSRLKSVQQNRDGAFIVWICRLGQVKLIRDITHFSHQLNLCLGPVAHRFDGGSEELVDGAARDELALERELGVDLVDVGHVFFANHFWLSL